MVTKSVQIVWEILLARSRLGETSPRYKKIERHALAISIRAIDLIPPTIFCESVNIVKMLNCSKNRIKSSVF